MARRAALPVSALLSLWLMSPASTSAQSPWVRDWLREYFKGGQAAVSERLKTIGSLKQLNDDLELISKDWLAQTGSAPEAPRRALVGFALEAAWARLDQPAAASKLLEWACRQVRRDSAPGEFDRRWHWAALALFEGAVDPDAIEAHLMHMRLQFPNEPRVPLVRGIAEELRVFTSVAGARPAPASAAKHGEEAVRRFQDAAKEPAIAGEANLRLGHALLQLGRFEQALDALNQAEPSLKDPSLVYLVRLFRGMALDRLEKTADARRAYEGALALRPGAQTATLSLATMLFRHGERDDASALTDRFLNNGKAPDDPWWEYWPGDFRMAPELVKAMREAMK